MNQLNYYVVTAQNSAGSSALSMQVRQRRGREGERGSKRRGRGEGGGERGKGGW